MHFQGISITTDNAPRLAAFYKLVLQEEPFIEGSHYSFENLNIYNPGDVKLPKDKTIWLMFSDANIDALHARLLRDIPEISILAPPERKPWGAYSFWFQDPDGNKISVFQP
ncbi:MAG: VOC family protein [Clostridiales bacterium]|nr:VOC family protein [Clostridiales bacterium]